MRDSSRAARGVGTCLRRRPRLGSRRFDTRRLWACADLDWLRRRRRRRCKLDWRRRGRRRLWPRRRKWFLHGRRRLLGDRRRRRFRGRKRRLLHGGRRRLLDDGRRRRFGRGQRRLRLQGRRGRLLGGRRRDRGWRRRLGRSRGGVLSGRRRGLIGRLGLFGRRRRCFRGRSLRLDVDDHHARQFDPPGLEIDEAKARRREARSRLR